MRLRARPHLPGGGGKRTRRPPGSPSGPGREFQPFPATPADTLRLANELLRMQSEHFSNHAFVLAPERVRPHATPFTGVSQIPTAPLVFTARQFRASSLWFRSLVCGARCGARTPLSSGRSSRLARSFWIVGHQAAGGAFGKTTSPPLPSQRGPSSLRCGGAVQLVFASFSAGPVPRAA